MSRVEQDGNVRRQECTSSPTNRDLLPPPSTPSCSHAHPERAARAWDRNQRTTSSGSHVPGPGAAPRFAVEPPPLVEYSNSTGVAIPCRPASGGSGATNELATALSWRRLRWLASAESLHQETRNENENAAEDEIARLEDEPLPVPGSQARLHVRQDGSLVFSPFKASDFQAELHSASYRCCLANQFGSLCSRPVRLRAVLDSNERNLEVFDEFALAGNAALLKCQPQAASHARYLESFAWFKNDKLLVAKHNQQQQLIALASSQATQTASATTNDLHYPSSGTRVRKLARQQTDLPGLLQAQKFLILPDGNLLIRNLTKLDSANYKCRAKHKLSQLQWSSKVAGQLIVDDSNTATATGNELRRPQSDSLVWVRENEPNFLVCAQFQSHPSATFAWFRLEPGNSKVLIQDGDNIKQLDSCLLFRQVQLRHAGTYLCEATGHAHGAPPLSATKRLVVSSAQLLAQVNIVGGQQKAQLTASVSPQAQHAIVPLGSSLQLNCSITGHPYDTIAWYKDTHLLALASVGAWNETATSNTGGDTWKSSSFIGSNLKLVQPTVISIESFNLKNRGVFQCQVYSSGSPSNFVSKLLAKTVDQSTKPNLDSANSIQTHLELAIEQDFLRSASGAIQLDVTMSRPSLVAQPRSSPVISVPRNSPLSLQCAATGLPAPRILWSLDDQPIMSPEESDESAQDPMGSLPDELFADPMSLFDERFIIGQVQEGSQVTGHLNISLVEPSESGRYKCVAVNSLGSSLAQVFQVNVIQSGANAVQLRAYQSQNITLIAGKSVSLQCPLIGFPLNRVDWFHNGQRLPTNNRQRIEPIKSGVGGQLELTNIDKSSDGGVYSCRVGVNSTDADGDESANIGDELIGQIQANIRVAPLIDTQSLPETVQANEGMRTKLVCSIAQGDHPIDVRWLRRVPDKTRFASVAKTLWFGYELVQNNPASLTGGAEQAPATRRNGEDSIAVLNLEDSCQLTFKQINYLDGGEYLCVASNDVSRTVRRTRVVVNVAPAWSHLEPAADESVQLGERLQLDCQAHGHPTPQVQWRRTSLGPGVDGVSSPGELAPRSEDFSDLISSYRHRSFANGSLVIEQVDQMDAGVYMCEVTNGIGVGLSRLIRVKVNVPPHFKQRATTQLAQAGAKVELKCLVYGDPPMIVGWRRGLVDVVDLVKDVRHRVVSEQQLTAQTSESILAIENLTRADSGQYACIASNEFGTEETRIQLVVQEPPEPPVLLRPIRATSRQATLSFKPPYSGNSPVRKYAIHYRPLAGDHFEEFASGNASSNFARDLQGWQQALVDAPVISALDESAYLAPNESSSSNPNQLVNLNLCCLKPYTRYAVRVRALNEIGHSEPSRPVQFVTDEETIGGPPLDVGVEATGAHSIKVRWRPPAINLQNGLIKGYYIGYKANAPQQTSAGLVAQQQQAIPGKSPNVRVFEQSFAEGEQYQYKNVQLDQGPSIRPNLLNLPSAQRFASGALEELSQPNELDAGTNASAFGLQTTLQSQQPQVFTSYLTNLRRKTSYSIIVQAYNKIGTGPRSDQIVVSTLDAAPPMSPILRLVSVTYDSAQLIKSSRRFGEPSNSSLFSIGPVKAISNAFRSGDELVDELDSTNFSPLDQDDDPQSYYTINYRVEETRFQQQHASADNSSEAWHQKRIQRRHPLPYQLTNLRCGSYYLAYMTATNSLGQSEPGETIRFNTMGAAPVAPKDSRDFLVVNATLVVLKLDAWQNAGCLIGSFTIKYRASNQVKWSIVEHQVHPTVQTVIVSGAAVFTARPPSEQLLPPPQQSSLVASGQRISATGVASKHQSLGDFIIRNLLPGMSFRLIVEANSESGSTVAEYEFETSNFSSSTVAINVNGIIASELENGHRVHNLLGQNPRRSDADFGEIDYGLTSGNHRNPLNKYALNVWSLTVIFVVASIFMAIATLVLGLRNVIRMKPPRGGGDGGGRPRRGDNGLLTSMLCCSSSSASSSSSAAGSSHSSSGGTCYQLPGAGNISGLGTGELAYCSLPPPQSPISLMKRAARYEQELDSGELKSIMGEHHYQPNQFRSQMANSSSLSTIGSQLAAAQRDPTGGHRHAQTLSRFGHNSGSLSNSIGTPMIGGGGAHIRAHYAATLGKQQLQQQSTFPMAPLKYNMSPINARQQHYLNLVNNETNVQSPYQSFQSQTQQQSDAGYETSTNHSSGRTETELGVDGVNMNTQQIYNLHSFDAYRAMSNVGNFDVSGNLFSPVNNCNNQNQTEEDSQCYGTSRQQQTTVDHVPQDAYGLLFGNEQVVGSLVDKMTPNQQNELNRQLSSLLTNHLQQTPN